MIIVFDYYSGCERDPPSALVQSMLRGEGDGVVLVTRPLKSCFEVSI
jgi:hypothetical protein